VTQSDLEPRFPITVVLAGIIWILYGSMILFAGAVWVGIHFSEGMNPELVEFLGAALIWAVFGGVLLRVGVRTVRRVAHDTLRSGIGSIIIGILFLVLLVSGMGSAACYGPGLIVAGSLAWVGRANYRSWRAAWLVSGTRTKHVPQLSRRSRDARPGQLVGRACVHCGERISSGLESRFCQGCGSPVHDRCARPGGGIGCPTCGATVPMPVQLGTKAAEPSPAPDRGSDT